MKDSSPPSCSGDIENCRGCSRRYNQWFVHGTLHLKQPRLAYWRIQPEFPSFAFVVFACAASHQFYTNGVPERSSEKHIIGCHFAWSSNRLLWRHKQLFTVVASSKITSRLFCFYNMTHANSLKRLHEGDEDSSYSSDPKRPVPKKPKLQTDRQHLRSEPNSTSPKDMQNYLYTELEKKQVGEEHNKIILPSDVKAIWAPRSVHSFYTNQSWYNAAWDKDCTLDAYLQIMSILIWINYTAEMWKDFKDDFIVPKRNDKCLPFELKVLQNLLGSRSGALARAFYDAQPIFCPLVIEERNEPITLEKTQRLPWLEEPEEIGRGAGGVVQKHKIAAGHLIYSNRGRNIEVSVSIVITTTMTDELLAQGSRNQNRFS
jgi:hypothetical protein